MEIRAVSQDHQLKGQWLKETTNCQIPGSYSDDHVSRNFEKNKFFVVQYSPYNQYNTVLNLLRVPHQNYNPLSVITRQDSLVTGLRDIANDDVPGGSSLGTQYYRPVLNSGQELQGDLINTEMRHGGTSSYEYSLVSPTLPSQQTIRNTNLGQLISGTFNSPSVTRNALNLIQTLDGNTKTMFRNDYDAPIDKTPTSSFKNIWYRNMLPTALTIPGRNIETGWAHDDNVKDESLPLHKEDDKVRRSVCPLIKLMNTQGVEVHLNTSEGQYELNIKGHGGLQKVLKMLHCVHEKNCKLSDSDEESAMENKATANRVVGLSHTTSQNEKPKSHAMYLLTKVEPIIEREHRNLNFIGAVPLESFATDKSNLERMNEGTIENSSETTIENSLETSYSFVGEMSSNHQERVVQPQTTVLSSSRARRSTNSSSVIMKSLSQNFKDISVDVSSNQSEQNESKSNVRENYNQNAQSDAGADVERETMAVDTNSRRHPYREESVIHRLGIMGNFNGNLGRIDSKNVEEKEFLVDTLSSNEISTADVVLDAPRPPSFTVDKGSSLIGNKVNAINGDQIKTDKETPHSTQESCLLDELSNSKAVKIRLKILDNQSFEFDFQGPGGLYDILEKIYHYTGIDDKKSLDVEKDSVQPIESQYGRQHTDQKIYSGYHLIPSERSLSSYSNEGSDYEAASSNVNYAKTVQPLNQNIHFVDVSNLKTVSSAGAKPQYIPAVEFSDNIKVISQIGLPLYISRNLASESSATSIDIPYIQTVHSTTELSTEQGLETFHRDEIAEDRMKSQKNYEVINLTESGLQLENRTRNSGNGSENGN